MKTIIKSVIIAIVLINSHYFYGQDTLAKQEETLKIEYLEKQKEVVKNQERDLLKETIEAIDEKIEAKEITLEEAKELKQKAAKKHALNIENKITIINNKLELLKRNEMDYDKDEVGPYVVSLGKSVEIGRKKKKVKYDKRSYNGMTFALGFNNAIIENQNLENSPYRVGGSGFVELGYGFSTRVFKNSNAMRLNYGLAFQWNKFNIKDNQYFVNNDGAITLEAHPKELNKVKFRRTNLVVPLYFEFGPSKKIEKKESIRYSTVNKFKIGVGGYAGLNLSTVQKIISKEDGKRVKEKIKNKFNTNDFVYGLGAYIGYDEISLYVKYDLSTVFKDPNLKQNNISLGVRFGL